MRTFQCTACGQAVFFENTQCGRCGSVLRYLSEVPAMAAFDVSQQDGSWRPAGMEGARRWRPCRNYVQENVCNWMVAEDDPHPLCASCRQSEIIPALDKPENRRFWALLETAKRRLFYTLDILGLARPGVAEDPVHGLRFHFLEEVDPSEQVLTGHDSGLVTLNVAEADDAEREARRTAMNEPYRTLLGHFRHEVGHFYWDRLIAVGPWLAHFRNLFGDESVAYGPALADHYRDGPPSDWQSRFISAYAASHPWEDWAETWAHYLHVMDALETADDWGCHSRGLRPARQKTAAPWCSCGPSANVCWRIGYHCRSSSTA